MSDKTTDNTDWLDEVLEQLAFEVADRHFRKSGNGYAERRKLDDVDVAKAKQAILRHEQQAIEQSARSAWNASGEGWNAEYPGTQKIEDVVITEILSEHRKRLGL